MCRQSICSNCSVCDRSVSNDCIVSNVSSDVSIATNVIIVVNISIVRGVKKKKLQRYPIAGHLLNWLDWCPAEVQIVQTEREALALAWACERFKMYAIGKEFELETDHKLLEYIYSQKLKPSARVERWVLRL